MSSDRYETVPATVDDAVELHGLFVAHRTAVLGFCHVTVEEVRTWLQPRSDQDGLALVVRDRESAAAVQWLSGTHERGDGRCFCLVVTRPDLARSAVDVLWSTGWARLRRWSDQVSAEVPSPRTIRSACLLGDVDERRRLEQVGLVHERTFWEMAGPATRGTHVTVPGLALYEQADPATVHDILQVGFRDHWDYHAQSFDAWQSAEQAAVGYAPDLWCVAELAGRPVAAMVLCRYLGGGELYVQELATLPRFRRQGLASALLGRAFEVARREGFAQVLLHVDSENADGAPRLYEAAGLRFRHATLQHVQQLP